MASKRTKELAAQLWCDPRVADREFDPELAEVIAEFLDEHFIHLTNGDAERFMKALDNNMLPNDDVNHPAHYTSHPNGLECIQITEHFNFCLGNVIKYSWRAGLKDISDEGTIKDLRKARWYLNREIERLSSKTEIDPIRSISVPDHMKEKKQNAKLTGVTHSR